MAPWTMDDAVDAAGAPIPRAEAAASYTGLRVIAVNPVAAAAGLHPGQNLADARALEPGLHAVPADLVSDSRALAGLADWCGRYSPWTAAGGLEADGAAGIWIDISGCAHLFGGEAALLDELGQRLADIGYAHCAAVADTPGAAWAVARYGGDGSYAHGIVPPGAQEAVLRTLPVAGLRLPPALVGDLDRLGLRRVGDLLALPRAGLASRFGAILPLRLDQALGQVEEPISPRQPPPSLRLRMTFPEPLGRPEDIAAASRRLLDALMVKLEGVGRGVRRLELTLYRSDGRVDGVDIATSRGNRDAAHLWRLLNEQLERMPEPASAADNLVDLLMVSVLQSEALAARQTLLPNAKQDDDDGPSTNMLRTNATQTALAALVDRLANRLGQDRVVWFQAQESHLPENAQRAVSGLAPANDSTANEQAGTPPQQPRPPRLLPRPEPVTAIAPVPDDPPVLFRWRGASHRVTRADGPERLAPEWWRATAPLGPQARDYYRVEDETGHRFWLYRAGLHAAEADPPQWYLHGFFG